jgi:hypothetical protein
MLKLQLPVPEAGRAAAAEIPTVKLEGMTAVTV